MEKFKQFITLLEWETFKFQKLSIGPHTSPTILQKYLYSKKYLSFSWLEGCVVDHI